MKNLRILLDLDEVLADFIGGACRVWRIGKREVLAQWDPGRWDIIPPLHRALVQAGKRPASSLEMAPEEFWSRINEEDDFWDTLSPTLYWYSVLHLVRSITDDWYIVSNPSLSADCHRGKAKWLKYYLGSKFDKFCLTSHKHLFAGPYTVLIDDNDSNVERFIEAGGLGIVYPAHHNSRHEFKGDPIVYLSQQLDILVAGGGDLCT